MATGGVSGEEELYSFELFECSVCLESLINKQPRLLSCGHTFCTPCLQQLSDGNTVNCPKCRSPTRLPPGGVQTLPKNTEISKMREREQLLAARNENCCRMCRKRDAKVEFFCTECPKGQICQKCRIKHEKISSLKSHQILPMKKTLPVDKNQEKCKDHEEVLEHFCRQCEEPICVRCICEPQHEQHPEEIVDFKTGLQKVKGSMNQLCQEFKDNTNMIEVCSEVLKQDMASLKESKEVLSAKCKDVETVLNKMKHQLNLIIELEHPVVAAYRETSTHLAHVKKQMTQIINLYQVSEFDFVIKAKEYRRNCHRLLNDSQLILNRKIAIPENLIFNIKIEDDVVQFERKEVSLKEKIMPYRQQCVAVAEKPKTRHETDQMLRSSPRQEGKNELHNLELRREIKPGGTVDMRDPLEVVSVGDGTVFLVDKGLNYLQRINTEGNAVKKYRINLNEEVYYKTACVYGDYLFVARSDNEITKMSLDGSDDDINLRKLEK